MDDSSAVPTNYQFGSFRLDVDRRRILENGRTVSWRSNRHFDLLRTIIDAEPDVVSYDTLKRKVWNGKEIEPQTIAQTVMNLRGRLGDYADCIRNQPGKGYYFDRPPSGALLNRNAPLEIRTMLDVASREWDRRTNASLLRALALFRQVLEIDPNCVEGQLGFAACITMGCHVGFAVVPKSELSQARHAAERALSLSQDKRHRAAALCHIAQIGMMYEWSFKEAEHLLDEARALDDSYPPLHQFLAHLYLITNRWEKVMKAIVAARQIAPASPMLHITEGLMLHFMRKHKEAMKICGAAVALHPEFSRGYVLLGFACEAAGEYDRALRAFETALEMEENPFTIASVGHLHSITGRRAKAHAALARLGHMAKTQSVSAYFKALIYVGLGDIEPALKSLEQSFVERCDWLIHANVEPRWDPLRHLPQFQRLIDNIGLPNSP